MTTNRIGRAREGRCQLRRFLGRCAPEREAGPGAQHRQDGDNGGASDGHDLVCS